MSGRRDDSLVLDDILDAAEQLVLLGEAASELGTERATNDRVLWDLTVLGEDAKRLNPSVRSQNPDVPWTDMAETRDRVVHHYEGVDWAVIGAILADELPPLLPRLRAIRDQLRRDADATN